MSPLLVTGVLISVEVVVPMTGLPHTEAVLQNASGTLQFVLPGANGGPPVAVWGVPALAVGQTWRVSLDAVHGRWVPRGLGAGMEPVGPVAPPWVLNGLAYQPEQLPLVFSLHAAGAAALGPDATEAAVEAALAQWTNVGCSTFAFSYAGRTEARFEDDSANVLSWEEDSWDWGSDVAGLTATRFGVVNGGPGPVGADIVFNGVDWTWTAGSGDVYANPATLHIDSVLTHELGHVTGMDHDLTRVTSTMFYAYIGGTWMGTLSGDDRRGLCENYPADVDECARDEDCAGIDASPRHCEEIDGVFVCDEDRDPIGSPCSRTNINCEEFCVFTNRTATEGYCTVSCADARCPAGFACGADDAVFPNDGSPICVPGEVDTADSGDSGDSGIIDTGAPAAPPDRPPPGGCGCGGGVGGGAGGSIASGILMVWSRRRRR